MKKFWTLLILIVCVLMINSFRESEAVTIEKEIIGKWVMVSSNEKELIFEKVPEFGSSKLGLAFYKNGNFINYMNSGFCGTPPKQFIEHPGTWKETDDKLIVANYKTWRGINKLRFFIKEVTESKLVLQFKPRVN